MVSQVCCCNGAATHTGILIFHLVFTIFHTDFVGFPYENHLVKIGYVVLMIYGYDYFWKMHKLCFAGTNKFKQNITSTSQENKGFVFIK